MSASPPSEDRSLSTGYPRKLPAPKGTAPPRMPGTAPPYGCPRSETVRPADKASRPGWGRSTSVRPAAPAPPSGGGRSRTVRPAGPAPPSGRGRSTAVRPPGQTPPSGRGRSTAVRPAGAADPDGGGPEAPGSASAPDGPPPPGAGGPGRLPGPPGAPPHSGPAVPPGAPGAAPRPKVAESATVRAAGLDPGSAGGRSPPGKALPPGSGGLLLEADISGTAPGNGGGEGGQRRGDVPGRGSRGTGGDTRAPGPASGGCRRPEGTADRDGGGLPGIRRGVSGGEYITETEPAVPERRGGTRKEGGEGRGGADGIFGPRTPRRVTPRGRSAVGVRNSSFGETPTAAWHAPKPKRYSFPDIRRGSPRVHARQISHAPCPRRGRGLSQAAGDRAWFRAPEPRGKPGRRNRRAAEERPVSGRSFSISGRPWPGRGRREGRLHGGTPARCGTRSGTEGSRV
jgi:hypothetical protein